MVRISGVALPDNKRIEVALMYIYGIGRKMSVRILDDLGIDKSIRTKSLSDDQVNLIRDAVKKMVVEGDLRRQKLLNIRLLREINCYRGIRHAKRLPVRGQRTKTNSRTVRGNVRKTMGSGRKLTGQKT
ncbi:MAG: 30S ribosomal protein S13 [Parcubacteria group bacterium]|nr:30S ribosomal protein S13 [Parcubacteria group bacterium]